MAAANASGGRGIAAGLRALGRAAASRQARTDRLAEALAAAASGEPLHVLGALGPLRWDADGALLEASLESWCIGWDGAEPSFWSSGASFDVTTGEARGVALRCGDDEGSAEPATSTAPVTGPITPPVVADAGGSPPDAGASSPDAAAEPSDAAPAEPRDAGAPPSAADASTTRPALDALVTAVHRDNTWQNGYCNTVALLNSGQEPVTWEVQLLVLGRLSDHWSCNVSGDAGLVAFTGVDWNRIIPPGQSTSFGFCVSR